MAAQRGAEGLLRRVDDRLGLATRKKFLRKVFPDHWSFMLGEVALWSFVVLLITGVLLTLWFKPDMGETTYEGAYAPLRGLQVSQAYASTLHISFDVRAGLLIRQTHHWAANIFIAGMFVHLIRVFVTGAFRKPREVNWIIGGTMLLLGIVEGFAGYSLPDDLLSGTGLRIAEGLLQSIPVVGSYLTFFLFGGSFPGDVIVSRLFIVHVLLIPGLLVGLIAAHLLILVYQKHTQWPAAGHAESNVVGFPMVPVYLAKSGGFFFLVFGITALMGGLFTINPIWLYGPYDPAQVTADSQPDWYMGLPEGLLRIMPGYETHLFGHTVMWNVFLPGVVLPMLFFLTFFSYPFLSAWASGDRSEHHLLQRPRQAPRRTAFLVAMMTLYGLLWAAGGDDVIALKFHLDVNRLVDVFRGAVVIGPALAYILTHRWCVSLQRQDRELLVEGRGTGTISRSADGGYAEAHQPLSSQARSRRAVPQQAPVALGRPPGHRESGRGGWRTRVRDLLAAWTVEDEVVVVPRREVRAEDGREPSSSALPGQTPVADGHQFDGRRSVVGAELRR